MHKVFITYHHGRDQFYKEQLVRFNTIAPVFIDRSVDTGDISDDLDDQTIREKIRDEYLRDSTVTIVLVGQATQKRKHVDWEIYSSMFDGAVNKRSGILVVLLPDANPQVSFHAAHESEKATVYPEYKTWVSVTTEAEFRRRYPLMPDRLIDNLVARLPHLAHPALAEEGGDVVMADRGSGGERHCVRISSLRSGGPRRGVRACECTSRPPRALASPSASRPWGSPPRPRTQDRPSPRRCCRLHC